MLFAWFVVRFEYHVYFSTVLMLTVYSCPPIDVHSDCYGDTFCCYYVPLLTLWAGEHLDLLWFPIPQMWIGVRPSASMQDFVYVIFLIVYHTESHQVYQILLSLRISPYLTESHHISKNLAKSHRISTNRTICPQISQNLTKSHQISTNLGKSHRI